MTEISINQKDIQPKKQPDRTGLPPFQPTFKDRAIDALEGNGAQGKMDRKTFIASATAVALAAVGIGTIAVEGSPKLKKSNSDQSSDLPQSTPETEEQLLNNIILLDRDSETGDLKFNESGVVQSMDVAFHGVETPENPTRQVILRREHHISDDPTKRVELHESEINGRGIKVIRAGAIGYEGYNDTHDDPQYNFKTLIDGVPTFVYEWLVPVKDTQDPNNPHKYVDGFGKPSETPWFVGPKFVDSTIKQSTDTSE